MKDFFYESKQYIAGGVNSPVRAFYNVGINPVFFKQGKKKYLYSEDGKKYLDFCMSWGPLILGHSDTDVVNAVQESVAKGTSFGAPTVAETELAKLICKTVPSIERIRFVNSGTEAVMTAVRIARGFTGRNIIVKFDGCYHGHSDSLLVAAGSGVTGLPASSSAGVPQEICKNTISIPYNNIAALKQIIKDNAKDIAAVIVEPVAGNMGVVLPAPDYLAKIRKLTRENDILLIFDEVITGFRIGLGGAQEYFNVIPDITTLGKIIGGGFPVGAVGGKQEIMRALAPDGPVYQAGTLSGNPVAMAAGLATLTKLTKNKHLYKQMENVVKDFAKEWKKCSSKTINHIASMFTIFHTESPVNNYTDAQKQNDKDFKKYFLALLKNNIYIPPSMFETSFVSIHHTPEDMAQIIKLEKHQP